VWLAILIFYVFFLLRALFLPNHLPHIPIFTPLSAMARKKSRQNRDFF
jgi:hypothetical protein